LASFCFCSSDKVVPFIFSGTWMCFVRSGINSFVLLSMPNYNCLFYRPFQ
jgi:hypothetical protein